jgi:hypothetical protein
VRFARFCAPMIKESNLFRRQVSQTLHRLFLKKIFYLAT